MLDKFDPNKPKKPDTNIWATYVPWPGSSRGPKFKTHTKLQFALSAADGNARIAIYKLIDGDWVTQYERETREKVSPDATCERCGAGRDGWRLHWEWKRGRDKKVIEPLQRELLCWNCERRSKGK